MIHSFCTCGIDALPFIGYTLNRKFGGKAAQSCSVCGRAVRDHRRKEGACRKMNKINSQIL